MIHHSTNIDDAKGADTINSQANMADPVGIKDVVAFLRAGHKVGLFLRHAERYAITPETPKWGNEVLLTAQGIEVAKNLGAALPPETSLGFWSSPVKRCQQTAAAIASGAGQTGALIRTHANLGDPGIYFDGSGDHEPPMKKDFHAFAQGYLKQDQAPGMLPLAATTDALLKYLREQMAANDCSFFITHDFFAAVMMHHLGLKVANRDDWCAFLEGVCLVLDDDKLSFRRFLLEPEHASR